MTTNNGITSWKTAGLVSVGVCVMLAAALGCGEELVEEPGSQRDVLKDLGVETDLGPRTGGDGEPIADDAHPLGSRIAMLTRVAELAGIGVQTSMAENEPYFILDNPTAEPPTSMLPAGADAAWTTMPIRDVAAADIDGDGLEETLIAYVLEAPGEIILRVIEDQSEELTESSRTLLSGLGEVSTDGYQALGAPALDLAAADFDGDGADEIVLAYGPLGTVFVFGADGQLLSEMPLGGDREGSVHVLRVEAGDPDGDGRDELVATESFVTRRSVRISPTWPWLDVPAGATAQTISLYHLFEADEGEIDVSLSGRLLTDDVHLGNATPTMGDFDGDRLAEIAFGGTDVSAGHAGSCAVLIMEDGRGMRGRTSEPTPYAIRELSDSRARCDRFGGDILSGDFDGDSDDELLFHGALYEVGHDGLELAADLAPLTGPALWYRSTAAVADFDGDEETRRDELAVVAIDTDWYSGFSENTLRIIGQNSVQQYHVKLQSEAGPVVRTLASSGVAPSLADVNLDNDSVVVEYSGETEIMFSEPNVIAVLASAPYYEGKTHADGHTVWGEFQESSSEHTANVGGSFSVGLGVKVEPEAPIIGSLGFAASVMVTTTFSFDFDRTWGHTEVQTIEYENPAGQDLVIFSTVPYDFYYYTVIAAPDANDVGEVFAIHVPRRAAIHHLDRDYYNAHNGDGVDVDESILGHTIGDPWSYPTPNQRDAALDSARRRQGLALASSRHATCSGSQSTVGLSVELSDTDAYSFGGSVSIAIETEVEIGKQVKGVATGALEAHVGYEYSMSSTSGIFFGGAVGDMDPDEWTPELAFDWGLFAHEANAGDQSFPVVTYWIE